MYLKAISPIAITVILMIANTSLFSQTNKSTAENYRVRESTVYQYCTSYDNGYVTLRDGTVLSGEISLAGRTYERMASNR